MGTFRHNNRHAVKCYGREGNRLIKVNHGLYDLVLKDIDFKFDLPKDTKICFCTKDKEHIFFENISRLEFGHFKPADTPDNIFYSVHFCLGNISISWAAENTYSNGYKKGDIPTSFIGWGITMPDNPGTYMDIDIRPLYENERK
jgi:hypothetical protein